MDADPHPVRDAHVLVTGAGGSIASRLCLDLAARGARQLTMLGLTESALWRLHARMTASTTPASLRLRYVLGSVTDRRLLNTLMPSVDIVIHAAAHKHVPLCEQNPCAAILNNIGGTQAVVQAAARCGVQRCVIISTDKAVQPTSIMGATKRVAEMVAMSGPPGTYAVRCGNVRDSDGSVLPLWRQQIAAGGPLTLTDPDCTRYFMSIEEACGLVLETLPLAPTPRGVYVFDMGDPVRMGDLADQVLRDSGSPCAIDITGLRPGDKLHEHLHYDALSPTPFPRIFRDTPPGIAPLALLADLLRHARHYARYAATHLLWEMVASCQTHHP